MALGHFGSVELAAHQHRSRPPLPARHSSIGNQTLRRRQFPRLTTTSPTSSPSGDWSWRAPRGPPGLRSPTCSPSGGSRLRAQAVLLHALLPGSDLTDGGSFRDLLLIRDLLLRLLRLLPPGIGPGALRAAPGTEVSYVFALRGSRLRAQAVLLHALFPGLDREHGGSFRDLLVRLLHLLPPGIGPGALRAAPGSVLY